MLQLLANMDHGPVIKVEPKPELEPEPMNNNIQIEPMTAESIIKQEPVTAAPTIKIEGPVQDSIPSTHCDPGCVRCDKPHYACPHGFDYTKMKSPCRSTVSGVAKLINSRMFENSTGFYYFNLNDVANALNYLSKYKHAPNPEKIPWGDAIIGIVALQKAMQEIGVRGSDHQRNTKKAVLAMLTAIDPETGNVVNRSLLNKLAPQKTHKSKHEFIEKCIKRRMEFEESKDRAVLLGEDGTHDDTKKPPRRAAPPPRNAPSAQRRRILSRSNRRGTHLLSTNRRRKPKPSIMSRSHAVPCGVPRYSGFGERSEHCQETQEHEQNGGLHAAVRGGAYGGVPPPLI